MTDPSADTAQARRAARISAAQALVKVQRRLGKASLPSVVALAGAAPVVVGRGRGRSAAS